MALGLLNRISCWGQSMALHILVILWLTLNLFPAAKFNVDGLNTVDIALDFFSARIEAEVGEEVEPVVKQESTAPEIAPTEEEKIEPEIVKTEKAEIPEIKPTVKQAEEKKQEVVKKQEPAPIEQKPETTPKPQDTQALAQVRLNYTQLISKHFANYISDDILELMPSSIHVTIQIDAEGNVVKHSLVPAELPKPLIDLLDKAIKSANPMPAPPKDLFEARYRKFVIPLQKM